MDIFDLFYFNISWPTLWAVLLIAIGVSLLIAQYRQQPDRSSDLSTVDSSAGSEGDSSTDKTSGSHFNIYRSRSDRKLAGVCAGLAKHFNIDPTLVRLGWVLATVASKGLGLLVYVIFIFIFPEETNEQTV
ncbi:MAG: PspC domain-containing protein [Calditrichaeota bacterium]|nr:PspC domain-containing protein [Calditrichota bacterium]MCB9087797.1 PspC domain-containing protein [Calditrichia bacterium]MCB0291482.1 PspC domain-containing protein [Calditrichota bacterium]MCB0294308.1 PspC domain-containing protein [Calditrichota bacterium]MCB0304289.1 PspC domain-containing protein [Calditrichota bacterium]